ncbi:hypothetical protein HK405_013774, partial [Cladochytrium tenue]
TTSNLAWHTTGHYLTFVPPATGSWVYEDVRNVTWNSASVVTYCGAAPSGVSYIGFELAGSGTATVGVQTSCAKTNYVSAVFSVSSSATRYYFRTDTIAGNGASTDLSAFVVQDIVSDGSTTWTLSDVIAFNDPDACGISGTEITA